MCNDEKFHIFEDIIDEKYEKADEIIRKIDMFLPFDEKIKTLDEAISICPYHFSAKLIKLDMNKAKPIEYYNLSLECKSYLENNKIEINLDNPDGNLWYSGGKIYIQILYNLGLSLIENKDYNNAIKLFELLVKLDENSKLEQELMLLQSYILNNKYDDAINYFNEIPNDLPSSYNILKLLAYIGNKDFINAERTAEIINNQNKYYFAIITGFVKLTEEDFYNFVSSPTYNMNSIEEACINIHMISPCLDKMTKNLQKFFKHYDKTLMDLMPKNKYVPLLCLLLYETELGEKTIINIFSGTSKKYPDFTEKLERTYTKQEAKELLNKVLKDQYIDYDSETQKYTLSILGISIMEESMSFVESDNNDDYELLF